MTQLPVQPAWRLADRPEQQRWLVDALWSDEAVGIIGGEPKCGKSFLALDLVVSVASGTPCLRRFPTPQSGAVLLFAAEDAPHVVRQRLSEVAEKSLDRADRDGFIVLPPVASLFAGVVAHTARDRRERHVFLDQRVGVEILPALHQVQITLDLFVRTAGVVAGRQLIPVNRPNRPPIARREKILALIL